MKATENVAFSEPHKMKSFSPVRHLHVMKLMVK